MPTISMVQIADDGGVRAIHSSSPPTGAEQDTAQYLVVLLPEQTRVDHPANGERIRELLEANGVPATSAIVVQPDPGTTLPTLMTWLRDWLTPGIPPRLRRRSRLGSEPPFPTGLSGHLAEVERAAIRLALELEANNHTRTARLLGISRRALIYKLDKYRLGKSRE